MVGLLPLVAVTTIGPATMARLPDFRARTEWFMRNRPEAQDVVQHMASPVNAGWQMLSIVDQDRLRRLLGRMLDPDEFLSDHGIRGLSKWHEAHPLLLDLDGVQTTLDYEPAESTSGLFGGNSNWRGPVWFPINFLLIESLRVYERYLGTTFLVEYPSGSGTQHDLGEVADLLTDRLIALFLRDGNGRRPVFGDYTLLQEDPAWRDLILFHEYFHADTGTGPRRLAPDRLDRPRRRPDHSPAPL